MRDPDGTLELRADHVARQLDVASPAARFLHSDAAHALSAAGRIVPYTFHGSGEIRSPRVAFVSHPHEWCDAQLRAAAVHTLDIARELLPHGHELKDASAWNVIFDGRKPVFCDHLSFVPIERREWWAFGQFVRHFILPLAMSATCGIPAHRAFQLDRDGLAPDVARSILGPRRFATRWWPLMMRLGDGAARSARDPRKVDDVQRFREHVHGYCAMNLARRGRRAASPWSGYTGDRPHYGEQAARLKRESIDRWLAHLKPRSAVDLGCNTGEFSRLLAASGTRLVIAIDADHDAIERLYESADAPAGISPVIANLADVAGGRGWMGSELPGLAARLPATDLVLALALTHHLAIAESIPLDTIARTLCKLTRSHAIVEWIGDDDPRLAELAAQRNRSPAEFSLTRQREAFGAWFDVEDDVELTGSERRLALLRRRET